MYPHLHLSDPWRQLWDWLLERVDGPPCWDKRDWERALTVCRQEQVEGLAYRLLKATSNGDLKVPERGRQRLGLAYQRAAARHLVTSHALSQIDEGCAGQGIQLMVLRGVVLADTLYLDPGCREFLDIDLVVPAGSYEKAVEILRQLDFESQDSDSGAFGRGPIEVDLHRDPANIHLFPAYGQVLNYDPHLFWSEAAEYSPYRNLRRPGEADELNFLILHLVKHSFNGLIWWNDIYRQIHRLGSAGLAKVRGRARTYRIQPLVEGLLACLSRLYPELPIGETAMPGGLIGLCYRLMLHGWRPPRAGMLMFLLSIPNYRWRVRLVADKLSKRSHA